MRLTGNLAKAFDKAERSSRDFARTLKHPQWNEFMKQAESVPLPTSCPVKSCYLKSAEIDMLVSHLARKHLWEPETIVQWLEENFC